MVAGLLLQLGEGAVDRLRRRRRVDDDVGRRRRQPERLGDIGDETARRGAVIGEDEAAIGDVLEDRAPARRASR